MSYFQRKHVNHRNQAVQVNRVTIPEYKALQKMSADELKVLSQHYSLAYVNATKARSALNTKRKELNGDV